MAIPVEAKNILLHRQLVSHEFGSDRYITVIGSDSRVLKYALNEFIAQAGFFEKTCDSHPL